MTKQEIIASLRDQAQDRDILDNGEGDIFAQDAQALREAVAMLEASEPVVHCKDCKWAKQFTEDYDLVYYTCGLRTNILLSDDYCNSGERRS